MYFLLENGLREQVHAQRLGWQGALFQAQRLGPASP
jgi:hypothetical protein